MILIGTKCRLEQKVTEELTAAKIGSGLLPVFGTPFMAAMMENAAQTALQNFLDEELYEIMAAPEDVLARCTLYENLPAETLTLYNDLWTKLGI